ncbi:hypothetical protein [Nocardioides sp. T2.26MG-1]|uniref:hypothetical protein n=1 Tax=Nocardioides sp. T2.26MG-1 TaxID=3041166 RepID=UPI00247742EF|nr:hypothetical protein [Nocardioides sp. T2.26MG-1]CAI9417210.1 hypothetical protein HIDPHFAB_02963 [Nocardioides sp. T2.26MG-1]
MTTVWQANAAAFTSRPESYIDQERHDGVRKATAALREGRPGFALFLLARSVERQNRIAGGGTVQLPICPRCGRTGRRLEHDGGVR